MVFFFSLLVDGALAGAIYALIALAFVLVYKASRMINFAIGEWVMWGALLVGAGVHTIGVGPIEAVVFACAAMIALAFAFSRLLLRQMTAPPVIASIMITLALGAIMRGIGAIIFAGVPSGISLPIPVDPIMIDGVPIATIRWSQRSSPPFALPLSAPFTNSAAPVWHCGPSLTTGKPRCLSGSISTITC